MSTLKRWKMNTKARLSDKKGFTLTELLVAVGIIAVVAAVAAIAVVGISRSVKQKDLDSKAEIIFAAAQARLTDLCAAGREEVYYSGEGVTPLGIVPKDVPEGSTLDSDSIYFVKSLDDSGNSIKGNSDYAVSAILPSSYVDSELWGHNWVIEYDRENAIVYGVFYTESDDDFISNYSSAYDSYRDKSVRQSKGAKVGYYGGNDAHSKKEDRSDLKNYLSNNMSVVVVNGEKLVVKMSCYTPNAMALVFYITLTDSAGHVVTKTLEGILSSSDYYTIDYVLDDVSWDAGRFANKFPTLKAGSDISVSVTVMTASASEYDPGTRNATTNSLFASIESSEEAKAAATDNTQAVQDTAIVTYGRHLMNLSTSSGLSKNIKYVVQRSSIDFAESTAATKPIDDWYAYYGSQGIKFTPITNENIDQYTVDTYFTDKEKTKTAYYTIHGMQIDETESNASAGMFSKFDGTLISHVNLIGSNVRGSESAVVGTLAGIVGDNATIEDCHVYLDKVKDIQEEGYTAESSLVVGNVTGGLVGEIAANVTIRKSSSSTIVGSSTSEVSGGLVGLVMQQGATLNIDQCYDDSYVYGKKAAGLVGSGNVASITNSYAVSYIKGSTQSAGFAGDEVESVSSCYSACTIMDGAMGNRYTTAKNIINVNRVYYSTNGTKNVDGTVLKSYEDMSNKEKFTEELGAEDGIFTTVCGTDNTHAYNLLDQGLTDYSYPRLSCFDHYGDWSAGLESGTFVYYEKYSDGTYGFYGGNTSALKAGLVVVGDGYGVIYTEKPEDYVNVSYQTGVSANGQETMSETQKISASSYVTISVGLAEYYIITMPKEISDSKYMSSDFYHKIIITRSGFDPETYYYNPHLAYTQTKVDKLPDSVPEYITVRSARQLYDLSLEYEYYYNKVAGVLYQQECDIDYGKYSWTDYTTAGEKVTSQGPIGISAEIPFVSDYNGGYHTISNVSYVGSVDSHGSETIDKVNVGLFGYNKGTLKNIFAVCEYADGGYILQYGDGAKLGKSINMGVIAGVNQGVISNCASAGYSATISAYESSSVKIGGLVGYNYGGRIENCSADCPSFTTEATAATVYIGGFCGHNAGVITSSYSLTSITVKGSKEDATTVISGFAGYNRGIIQSSYCTASLLTSGTAVSNGFTTAGGSVKDDCRYLDSGFYNYVGETVSYVYTDSSAGSKVSLATSDEGLESFTAGGFGKVKTAGNTLLHSKTPDSSTEIYPYGAIVKDKDGDYIHFGNWAKVVDPGLAGVFYWEREEGGSNDGIHVNFVFWNDDNSAYQSISTLCEMHDDGGAITEYGYGYYYDESISVSLTTETGNINLGSEQSDINGELRQMLSGYVFHSYMTGHESMSTMYLTGTKRNTLWTLEYKQSSTSYVHRYFVINPFFGNAISTSNNSSDTSYGPGYSEEITTNHLSCPYEIRNVKQLQYLNWNYSTKNVTTAVTVDNYKQYTYLQYATRTGRGTAYASSVYKESPKQYYKQSHDLNMYYGKSGYISNFNPIAGTYLTSMPSSTDNDVNMRTWFGGQYDGQSYTIKNVYLKTNYVNVGIFGTTLGAVIKNIIVYGDNSERAQIIRDTGTVPLYNTEQSTGSYVIGGLVGYAYDYNEGCGDLDGDGNNDAVIRNCAISGYKIIDNSTTRLGLAGANIGGLLGVSRVALNQCSSVVDIEVNCTHREGSSVDSRYLSRPFTAVVAASANHVRVGGIVGANRYVMTDCYSGGNINVGERTLEETGTKYDILGFEIGIVSEGSSGAHYLCSTHVFIGGLSGSSFCPNFFNIVGNDSDEYGFDGEPTFVNCYTYMDFPAMKGTIRAISIFGSLADRYWIGNGKVVENNCYYLDSSANVDVSNACNIRFLYKKYTLREKLAQGNYYDEMLKGNLYYLYDLFDWYGGSGGSKSVTADITSVTYDQLAGNATIDGSSILDKLNKNGSNYAFVTTHETIGGVTSAVRGKYSFGDGNSALEGQNYPFPTIITQQNSLLDDPTVHVHYGKWPLGKVYFQDGKITFDIFEQYNSKDKQSVYGNESGKEIVLKISDSSLLEALKSGTKTLKTRFIDSEGDEVSAEKSCIVIKSMTPDYSEGTVKFVVLAKNKGTVYIEAYVDDVSTTDKSSMAITVTANAELVADPGTITDYEENINTVKLYIKNTYGADEFKFGDGTGLTEDNLGWTIESGSPEYATVDASATRVSGSNYYESKITNISEGNTVINYSAIITLDLGETYGKRTFDYDTVVSVEVLPRSYIGVGFTGATPYVYNQGAVPTDTITDAVTGKDKVFTIGTEPYIASASSFLYCKGDMADAERVTITSVTLPDVDAQLEGHQYQYSWSKGELIVQGNYSYYPISVTGAISYDRTETMVVTVEYQYAEGYPNVTYTLTGKCIVKGEEMVSVLLLDYNGNALLDDVYGIKYGTSLNLSDIADIIREPKTPSKQGYHNPDDYRTNASLWNTKRDGSGSAMGQKLTADTNYYLQLEPNEYTIVFDGNGATGGSMSSATYKYDEEKALPQNKFTYDDNKFAGWNTKADGSGTGYADKEAVINLTAEAGGSITLYAQWSYAVKYDSNGGTVVTPIATQYKEKNIILTLEDNLDANGKNNYVMTGKYVASWNTKADGTGTPYNLGPDGFYDENEPVTLYAQWADQWYTITYEANYAGADPAVAIDSKKYGTTDYVVKDNTTFTRPGKFILSSWNTKADGSGTSYIPGVDALEKITGEVTLYAQWTQYYDVTYYANYSGHMEDTYSVTKVKGASVKLLAYSNDYIKRSGMYVVSWNTKADGSGTTYTCNSKYKKDADLDLYAQWGYRIKYSANGGKNSDGSDGSNKYQYKLQGATVTLNDGSNYWTKEGYDFIGWNTKKDGTGTKYMPDPTTGEQAKYSKDANVTLYAQWKVKTYKVTYDSNFTDSELPVLSEYKTHGEDLTLWSGKNWPEGEEAGTTYERAGYELIGWNTEKTPTEENPGTAYDLTGTGAVYKDNSEITLYAQWIEKYTITYHINYDDKTDTVVQYKIKGQKINLLDNTTFERERYSLPNWTTNSDGSGLSYTPGQEYEVEGNVDLYAKWKRDTVPVTYHSNYGTDVTITINKPTGDPIYLWNAQKVAEETDFSKAATDAGMHIVGWNTVPIPLQTQPGISYDLGEEYNPQPVKPDVETGLDLYAQWELNTYTIKYDTNGGDGCILDQTKTHGTAITLSTGKAVKTGETDLSREGYEFVGWNAVKEPTEENPGTYYACGASYTRDEENDGDVVTLYAQWQEITYDVTYSKDSKTTGSVPDAQKKYYWSNLELQENTGLAYPKDVNTSDIYTDFNINFAGKTNPDRKASIKTVTTTYKAAGWKDASGNTYDFGGTYTSNADVNLSVDWETNTVTTYSSITLPTPDAIAGYRFDGWYYDTSGSSAKYVGKGGDKFTPESDIKLYAHWTRIAWLVTFNCNGGSAIASEYVQFDSTGRVNVSMPAEGTGNRQTSKEGYNLTGWTVGSSTKPIYSSGTNVEISSDTTFTANWTELAYTITLNSNVETGSTTATITKRHFTDKSVTLSNVGNFTRANYTLTGWNTQANGTGTSYALDAVYSDNSDLNLFAQWTLNSYTITWDSNGGAFSDHNNNTSYTEKRSDSSILLPTSSTVYKNAQNNYRGTHEYGSYLYGWTVTYTSSGAKVGDYKPGETISNISSNITCKAIWKRRIVFKLNKAISGISVNDSNFTPIESGSSTEYWYICEEDYAPSSSVTFTLNTQNNETFKSESYAELTRQGNDIPVRSILDNFWDYNLSNKNKTLGVVIYRSVFNGSLRGGPGEMVCTIKIN